MQTTASLPHGRLHAFMQQRVCYEGAFMVRQEAYRMAAAAVRRWDALDEVIDLPELEIAPDGALDPAADDEPMLDRLTGEPIVMTQNIYQDRLF